MISGNQAVILQITSLINELLRGSHGNIYPFIIIAGPAHIGKSSLIREIFEQHQIPSHDIADLIDLSDNRIDLKNHNDLTGTSHLITINVDTKRQDIKLNNGSYVHNRGIRELNTWLSHSSIGSDKVVLIENLERANGSARNALLKTLEEPLPHRLIIATTSNIQELPATIISRAMIFQMDLLNDSEMIQWIKGYDREIDTSNLADILVLASGRPGVISTLNQQGSLNQVLGYWQNLQAMLTQKSIVIALLFQQMVIIHKSAHLRLMIDSILVRSAVDHPSIFQHTYDLLLRLDSNVNIENLLFDRSQSLSQIQ